MNLVVISEALEVLIIAMDVLGPISPTPTLGTFFMQVWFQEPEYHSQAHPKGPKVPNTGSSWFYIRNRNYDFA